MGKFCPLPWLGVFYAANGDIKPCSVSKLKIDRPDPSADPAEYWERIQNSQVMKNVRRELLKGGQPSNCSQCWKEESHGLTSYRHHMLYTFPQVEKRAAAVTDSEGGLSGANELQFFDIRLGNECNLKCRMCNPEQSSAWAKDAEFLTGAKYDGSQFQWHKNPEIWIKIFHKINRSVSAGIPVMLYMAGGELLMLRRHLAFLRQCVAMGLAKSIGLRYSSNITVLHDEIFGLWENFRSVELGASIDGVGRVNDYIRHPSKWQNIEGNLDRLLASKKVRVWVQPSVTIYNVFNVPELLLWAQSKKLLVHAHLVFEPELLNIQKLPLKSIEILSDYYAKFKSDLSEYDWIFLKGIVQYAKAGQAHGQLEDFWRYTKTVDRLRGENYAQNLPELARFLGGPASRIHEQAELHSSL